MVKVYGKEVPEIAINIKANIKMIKNGDMVYLPGLMEMFFKEIIQEIYVMDMDKCYGRMAATIKEIGKMVFNMEKVLFCLFIIQANYLFLEKV